MISLRRATADDIPQIRQLFQQTILTINRKDYSPEQVEAWAARGEDYTIWESRIAEQYFIVAEINSIIAGFAALKTDGYLNSLFVHKDYQHIGIASVLLMEIERYAEQSDLKEITAEVSITAKAFFEKQGFAVIKQQVVNIGIDMINYVMSKKLN